MIPNPRRREGWACFTVLIESPRLVMRPPGRASSVAEPAEDETRWRRCYDGAALPPQRSEPCFGSVRRSPHALSTKVAPLPILKHDRVPAHPGSSHGGHIAGSAGASLSRFGPTAGHGQLSRVARRPRLGRVRRLSHGGRRRPSRSVRLSARSRGLPTCVADRSESPGDQPDREDEELEEAAGC
jgi:hypothetical protein